MTVDRLLGDPVPPASPPYYDAIDGGRFADAAATASPPTPCTPSPLPGVAETAPRAVTVGSAALLAALRATGARSRGATSPLLCVADGRDRARRRRARHDPAERPIATFVGSARDRRRTGCIDRYLAFSCHRRP